MNQNNNIEYFIEKDQYYDKHGNAFGPPSFFIKYRKSFMFIKYWKYITYKDYSWGEFTLCKLELPSYKDAENFICNVLCKGRAWNRYELTTEGKITCNTCGCDLTK